MTASRLLAVFVFYVAAVQLGLGRSFIGAVASPAGLVLLAGVVILLAWSAVRAARASAPLSLRAARVLLRAGAALLVAALPASLVGRDAIGFPAGEGQEVPADGGLPPLRFGEVTLAAHGPHVLSKTVEIEALAGDGGETPVRIGLFPPVTVGARRISVFRFGYAPGLALVGERGATIAEGLVKLGTMAQTQETASLVQWTPETNLMMGAGTFPPRLEDLFSPPGSDLHVFLRFVEATLGGTRRDLTDPNAYRWLLDGRPEAAVLFVQVFRAREKVFEGRVRAGEAIRFPGGALAIAPEVLLWVDLLAIRDPFLPAVGIALALLAVGAALRAWLAASQLARRIRRRRGAAG